MKLLSAFRSNGENESRPPLIGSSADFPLFGRTPGEAGLYLVGWAVVLLLGASGIFRTRDVT